MKTTLPLLALLVILASAAPPKPISARTVTIVPSSKKINERDGTKTAAGILNIIGGVIPGPAGAIVGDVGKGLGGGAAAGGKAGAGMYDFPFFLIFNIDEWLAGAGTGTAAAAGSATTGSAKAAKAGAAGGAGGATKAAGKKAEKAA
ncbi:hypothetical protein N431DRAFT_74826 [Stipitochalara longipes BDJ]|nr:hypothetical protein N431DRAFT_74826 [Stipitochalara longipes BDJ]